MPINTNKTKALAHPSKHEDVFTRPATSQDCKTSVGMKRWIRMRRVGHGLRRAYRIDARTISSGESLLAVAFLPPIVSVSFHSFLSRFPYPSMSPIGSPYPFLFFVSPICSSCSLPYHLFHSGARATTTTDFCFNCRMMQQQATTCSNVTTYTPLSAASTLRPGQTNAPIRHRLSKEGSV
jgi:hypothetical protein